MPGKKKTQYVINAKMFEELYRKCIWNNASSVKIVGSSLNEYIVLKATDYSYDMKLYSYVKSVYYEDEYVKINYEDSKVFNIRIKKNGVPSSLSPFKDEFRTWYNQICSGIQGTEAIITCDLPELNMWSLNWLLNWRGYPEIAKIDVKKLNAANKRTQMQDVLVKLCGGLLKDILIEYDDMFSYEDESDDGSDETKIIVPNTWYFNPNRTEFYTGHVSYNVNGVIYDNSPFLIGGYEREGCYESIIDHCKFLTLNEDRLDLFIDH